MNERKTNKITNATVLYFVPFGIIAIIFLGLILDNIDPQRHLLWQAIFYAFLALGILFIYGVWKWKDSIVTISINDDKLALKYIITGKVKLFELNDMTENTYIINGSKCQLASEAIELINIRPRRKIETAEIMLKFKNNEEAYFPPTMLNIETAKKLIEWCDGYEAVKTD